MATNPSAIHSSSNAAARPESTVVSLFGVSKRRYEMAVESFNSCELSGRPFDDIIDESRLLDAVVTCQNAMLATPAEGMADVIAKVQISQDELEDPFTDWAPVIELLAKAIDALQEDNRLGAIRLLDRAIAGEVKSWPEIFEPAMDGARHALKDLHRMEARP